MGAPVAGEARRGPLDRCPLAGPVRRARRVAGPGRDLQHGVRPLAGGPACQPGRHQSRRPHLARARDRRAAAAVAPEDPHRRGDLVPAVQRARGGERPRVALDARGPGRRRLAAHRPKGVDELRAPRPVGHLPRAHRRGRTPAPGHLVPRRRHGSPGHRRPAPRPDHGRGRVQRGVPRRSVPSSTIPRSPTPSHSRSSSYASSACTTGGRSLGSSAARSQARSRAG